MHSELSRGGGVAASVSINNERLVCRESGGAPRLLILAVEIFHDPLARCALNVAERRSEYPRCVLAQQNERWPLICKTWKR